MSKAKQTFTYVGVLLFVILLNFWLPRLLRGGPIDYLNGSGNDGGIFLSEAQKTALLSYYHLNDSLWMQFVEYLRSLFTFDFGLSFLYKAPVADVIAARLPWTLLVVGGATLISIVAGLAIGLLSAWRHPGRSDRGLFVAMLTVSAVPEFLVGTLVLILFAVQWGWLPLGGAKTAFYHPGSWLPQAADVLRHAALPIVTLAAGNLASIYLLMRNEAIRVRREPFVEFAAAKGIGDKALMLRHVARSASLPLVTVIMMRIGGMLAGSVLTETVFSYPGIGKLLQEAILARDYPLLHGLFLLMTLFVLFFNIAADWLYPRLDPRIRTAKKGEMQ
ncbi:ABC transporter permease [Paenibacillus protaetiae]|uniref:ABC transporter permease n=1 Tax=Paenibacillus protaetiae TaxID=2509456 RepID=A0A4P6F2X1_9BACL|nr:ABC transporter permease [Paenibacillus protaetiae]QAY67447.1 ABC transporter permease [Paenibacillus protaetiae]